MEISVAVCRVFVVALAGEAPCVLTVGKSKEKRGDRDAVLCQIAWNMQVKHASLDSEGVTTLGLCYPFCYPPAFWRIGRIGNLLNLLAPRDGLEPPT